MNNPLITKKNEQDVSKMNNNSGKANMGYLHAQMQSRQMKEANDAVKLLMEDPDLFDYDGDYDRIQAARKDATAAKKNEKKESRLIACIQAAKGQRERETLIRKDRLAEKEIQRTGNIGLKDERYITSSYLKELEENKKFLEDDKKKEEKNQNNSALQKGNMESFHKNILTNNFLSGRADLSKQIDKEKDQSQKQQEKEKQSHQNDERDKQFQNKYKDINPSFHQQNRRPSSRSPPQNQQKQKEKRSRSRESKTHSNKNERSRSQDRRDRNKRSRSTDKERRGKDRRSRSNDKERRKERRSRSIDKERRGKDRRSKSIEKERRNKLEDANNEASISKEEKIRLAKERYLQRQNKDKQTENK